MSSFYAVNPSFSSPFDKSAQLRADGEGGTFLVDHLGLPLGILTKSQSNLVLQRFQRYTLQDRASELLPKERVSYCLKRRIDSTQNRTVLYNQTRKNAHYGNVQRCGSVWSCPVCAANVTEKRRIELKQAVDGWKNTHGGSMLLMTLTNSHNAKTCLKTLKTGQKKAMAYFFGDRVGKGLLERLGRKHHITNYEVTHGSNGWHPHHHILLFVSTPIDQDMESLVYQLKNHWINCCRKAGLPLPSFEHGLDLRDGTYAEQYVGKWGIEHEMTKGHLKFGKAGGLTPFDMLRLSVVDEAAGRLFQEFAISFKGSRQLVWSRGLKALVLVVDKTDEELSEETEKDSITLCDVPCFIFSLLRKYKQRANFLQCIERDYENGSFGDGSVQTLISDLMLREYPVV